VTAAGGVKVTVQVRQDYGISESDRHGGASDTRHASILVTAPA
jgi:hypothetical protein